MRICIDTTILIDVLKDTFRDSQDVFYSALAAKETLVVPVVVFAELMPQFKGNTNLVNEFLKDHNIKIESLDVDAVSIAGARWMRYLKRKSKDRCPHCKRSLITRHHFLSDFYVGGFAVSKCDAILTRDRGIYKKYFPEIQDYRARIKAK